MHNPDMTHDCVCGRSFRHQPNLSRHQRGNVKQGIPPCLVFLERESLRLRELTTPDDSIPVITKKNEIDLEKFNESVRTLQVVKNMCNVSADKPDDYQSSYFPDSLKSELFKPILPDRSKPFRERIHQFSGKKQVVHTVKKLVLDAFRLIHVNEDYPRGWNVVLQNIKTMRLLVYKEDKWVDQDFVNLVQEFTKTYLSFYLQATEDSGDLIEASSFYMSLYFEEDFMKDIQNGFSILLKDPVIRDRIKKAHNIR